MTTLTPVYIQLETAARAEPDERRRVDVSDLAERARLMCPRAHAAKVKARLSEMRRRVVSPWLARFGSGDFHHLSLMLLETLPTPARPVSLVLFDNHPDWFVLPPRYHCGNWVAGVLGLPWIERVILIGQGGDDLKFAPMHFAPAADLASGRLTIHPYRVSEVRAPMTGLRAAGRDSRLGADRRLLRFETVESVGLSELASRLAAELAGRSVYISVDKDCLRASDAATDWDQGEIGLEELASAVRVIGEAVELVGADVCGGRASTPMSGLFKRFDAGRMGKKWVMPSPAEITLNARADRVLGAAFGVDDEGSPVSAADERANRGRPVGAGA